MQPFLPKKMHEILDLIDVHLFMEELINSHKNISIYQTKLNSSKIPWDLLSYPLMLTESLQSSKIEGTQATIDEVLESDINNDKKNIDVNEVLNYYKALLYGEKRLKEIPISTRLIKELHEILLSENVRGKNKSPGEYRRTQNYIGPQGCTIKTATFVPPEPQLVDEYISDLENFINDNTLFKVDHLIKISIIHAQFETIHPFLDGNGRIGRILIPLYLYNEKITDNPNFYLSPTLEKDRHKYYRLLNDTRLIDNWNEWIKFFLESIDIQAKENISILDKVEKAYEMSVEMSRKVIKNSAIIDVVGVLFRNPINNAKSVAELTGIPESTCRKYLRILEEEKIIYSDGKKRNKTYYNYNLLDIIR